MMRLKENYKIRDVAGEKVLVIQGNQGIDLTKLITLNSSSELLWSKLIGKDFTEEDVIEILITNYKIDNAVAKMDAISWINSLKDAGLME